MANSEESGSSSSSSCTGMSMNPEKKYNGIRLRKWGKWVSEIRVPGTQERLWLGSYSTPEGAAMAHDMALFYLRGPNCSTPAHRFNFPSLLPANVRTDMSPRSIQKAASDAGMAIDAQFIINNNNNNNNNNAAQHDFGMVDNASTDSYDTHGNYRMMSEHGRDNEFESSRGGGGALSISIDDYL